jgi:hypothetical protein
VLRSFKVNMKIGPLEELANFFFNVQIVSRVSFATCISLLIQTKHYSLNGLNNRNVLFHRI